MTVQMQHVPLWAGTLERNSFEALLPTSWLSSVGIVDCSLCLKWAETMRRTLHVALLHATNRNPG